MRPALLVLILWLASCSPTLKLSNENLGYLYSKEGAQIQLLIHHRSPVVSTLYLKIPTGRLNYVTEIDEPSAELTLRGSTSNGYELPYVDSFQFVFHLNAASMDSAFLVRSISFPANSDSRLVHVTIKDENGPYTFRELVDIDKRSANSRQHFLTRSASSKLPLFSNALPDEQITISHSSGQEETFHVDYYHAKLGAAFPAHIANVKYKMITKVDSSFTVSTGEPLRWNNYGLYHVRRSSSDKEGKTLFRFHQDYPRLTRPEEMIKTLRYITKNKEYDAMLKAPEPKVVVDSFWIKRAGNMDRARVLIREYYSRVEFANNHFTSYKEGWKSDRGVIYIVYGPPARVYRSDNYETWIFEETVTEPQMRFIFHRVENKFSSTHFELQRDVFFENSWNMAIHKWRHGRVSELQRR